MTWSRRVVGATAAAGLLLLAGCDDGSCCSPEHPTTAPVGDAAKPAALFQAACEGDLRVGPGVDLPDELAEISGIAPSSERADVVWAVGDGGSAASVYAVDLHGNIVATVEVAGVDNNDWEDLAAGPAPDGSGETWLYVADIGDNTSERERIRIQGFPEPALTTTSVTPRTILAHYATGATDAEALAVTDDGIWILGKEWAGGSAPLYHLGFDELAAVPEDQLALVEPTGFELGSDGVPVTAMDAASTSGVAAVRTYGKVWLFDQATPDLPGVLATEPCEGPPIVEGQGESVAATSDGRSLVTASEAGSNRAAELHVVTIG